MNTAHAAYQKALARTKAILTVHSPELDDEVLEERTNEIVASVYDAIIERDMLLSTLVGLAEDNGGLVQLTARAEDHTPVQMTVVTAGPEPSKQLEKLMESAIEPEEEEVITLPMPGRNGNAAEDEGS